MSLTTSCRNPVVSRRVVRRFAAMAPRAKSLRIAAVLRAVHPVTAVAPAGVEPASVPATVAAAPATAVVVRATAAKTAAIPRARIARRMVLAVLEETATAETATTMMPAAVAALAVVSGAIAPRVPISVPVSVARTE